jgi:hypothetical protein
MNTDEGKLLSSEIAQLKRNYITFHDNTVFKLLELATRDGQINVDPNQSVETCVYEWIYDRKCSENYFPPPLIQTPFYYYDWLVKYEAFKDNFKVNPNTNNMMYLYTTTCDAIIEFIKTNFLIV